ncbi:hypothetical protein PR048_011755 [Dryococelus australis]|uniref:Uncharacterized protein n=1 Tax=Dryococelus australis TaxID=614101 RepID=A0ABQ9HMJ7_9NEOP|nr:hypothetical protein PR048_011755 [Dryococelus australis]
MRPPKLWHFRSSETKRFSLTKSKGKVLIRGKQAYNVYFNIARIVCKPSKSIADIKSKKYTLGYQQNNNKIKDVGNLLVDHYGNNWRGMNTLSFYKDAWEEQHKISL